MTSDARNSKKHVSEEASRNLTYETNFLDYCLRRLPLFHAKPFKITNNFNTFIVTIIKSQCTYLSYEPIDKVVEVFEKFIASDNKRLDLITNLNKGVLELENKVKSMKGGK